MNLVQRIKDRLRFGMTDATVIGDGYEALVLKEGIVVGRVYLGTVEEVESPKRFRAATRDELD